MEEICYSKVINKECICIAQDKIIKLILKDSNDHFVFPDIYKINNCILSFNDVSKMKISAYIEKPGTSDINTAILYPKYYIWRYLSNKFSSMEIKGDIIDDFFSPMRYFYEKKKESPNTVYDISYNSVIIDKWTIEFEGNDILISLISGDLLTKGELGDQKLHATLQIEFKETNDIEYVNRVYEFVVTFLKLITYKKEYGKLNVDLFTIENGKKSHNGKYINVDDIDNKYFPHYFGGFGYICYKPYIERFLQFVANEGKMNLNHLPENRTRFFGKDYTYIDFINIFNAFERECDVNSNYYLKKEDSKIENIRNRILNLLDLILNDDLSHEEIDFLSNVKKIIGQNSRTYGLRKKISITYNLLKDSFSDSLQNIFYKERIENSSLSESKIKDISDFLVGLRGKIVHGNYCEEITDDNAINISFFEILVYMQILKRAGFEVNEINDIIDVVFHQGGIKKML